MKVTIVVGNPKPKSRTAQVAEQLVRQVFGQEISDFKLIDLADHVDQIFAWPSNEMAALNQRVAESDLAVFASPTYKATYTGLLKAFLDRYPANGLKGTSAIGFMTGAGPGHSLGSNNTLVPLLFELGAAVLVRGLYFDTNAMDQSEQQINNLSAEIEIALKSLAPAIKGLQVGKEK